MTIKEFAKLCNCNPQTLRYYDKEDLLKPKTVDVWTGYRNYSEEQALDFVKIKNLQEADFSIKEIKKLLTKSDEEIYLAFDRKIEEQVEKLERIRRTQATYLSEKQNMETKIKEIKENVMAAAKKYDPQEEFGITQEYYDSLMVRISELFESSIKSMEGFGVDFSDVETTNGVGIEEEQEYLNPLENDTYKVIYEKHGWEKTKEIFEGMSKLESGGYMLYFEMRKSKIGNMAFLNVIMGCVLDQNEGVSLKLNCNVTESNDDLNHFWLLKEK